jgi:cysteine desulfurase/selenocysteine lyase
MLKKKDFPIFGNYKDLVYFDSAATSQKPRLVLDEIINWYSNFNANIDRGLYDLAQKASLKYELARKDIADIFMVDPSEAIFIKNTTEGINLLASGFEKTIKNDQNIVISQQEHHSNYLPWLRLAKNKGSQLRVIKLKNNHIDLESASQIIDSKTAIVAVSHASNVLGYLSPIKELASLAHKSGAKLIVDGSQVVAHQPIHPWQIGADAYIFSGHKVYGPNGSGILFLKKEFSPFIEPLLVGGDMVSNVSSNKIIEKSAPGKYEGGTQNPAAQVALSKVIKTLSKDWLDIIKYEKDLIDLLITGLSNLGVIIHNPNPDIPLVTFSIKDWHCHDIASLLNEQNIAVRAGYLCAQPLVENLNKNGVIRASLALYNTPSDVNKFIIAIKKIIEKND